jgi:low affinity Fe/Cu permease
MSENGHENSRSSKVKAWFNRFARAAARIAGHPAAFLVALGVVVVWAVTGPIFQYSNTWQLFINTGTTIVTFLMVFLIQNAQNRESLALQLKMDEVIRAVEGAHNTLMNLEDLEDEELEEIHKKYTSLAQRAREMLDRGEQDVGCPDLDGSSESLECLKAKQSEEVEASPHAANNGSPAKHTPQMKKRTAPAKSKRKRHRGSA